MELETLILSERKSEGEKQIPYDLTYIWNLIYGTNEPFHRKENHGLGEQTGGCRGGGSGIDWELGLIDTNSCLWNGWAVRACCVALGSYVQSLMMEHDNVRK